MRRYLIVALVFLGLGAQAQLGESVIRMKILSATFGGTGRDSNQLVRYGPTLYRLTHAVTGVQSLQTAIDSSWVEVVGDGAGDGLWQAVGQNAYYKNTGEVGVGITNPSAKLHVVTDLETGPALKGVSTYEGGTAICGQSDSSGGYGGYFTSRYGTALTAGSSNGVAADFYGPVYVDSLSVRTPVQDTSTKVAVFDANGMLKYNRSTAGKSQLWQYDSDSNIVNNNPNGLVRLKTVDAVKAAPDWALGLGGDSNTIIKYPFPAVSIGVPSGDTTGWDALCQGLLIWNPSDSSFWQKQLVIDTTWGSPTYGDTIGCQWVQPIDSVVLQAWQHTAAGTIMLYPADKVGVGTSAPTYKLHVLGTVYGQDVMTGVRGYSPGGNGVNGITQTGIGVQAQASTGYGAYIATNGGIPLFAESDKAVPLDSTLIFNAAGKLGIGTTNLDSNVTVMGSGRFTNGLKTGYDAVINGVTVGRGRGSLTENTAIGTSALSSCTSGSYNTSIGYESGKSNTTGSSNVYLGSWAGNKNTMYSDNTFVGYSAGYKSLNSSNTYIGSYSGYNNTNSQNTFIGTESGYASTSAAASTVVGYHANRNGNAKYGTLIGWNSGCNTTGYSNTAVGVSSLYNNTTGHNNIALGDSAGYSYTTLSNRMYLGARDSTTTGIYWNRTTGINKGYWNGSMNIKTIPTGTGTDSVLTTNNGNIRKVLVTSVGGTPSQWHEVGDALYYTDGAVGVGTSNPLETLHIEGKTRTNGLSVYWPPDSTGIRMYDKYGKLTNEIYVTDSALMNTFVGFNAGKTTFNRYGNGKANTAIGYDAFKTNVWGDYNTAIGQNALKYSTTGISNVAIGQACMEGNTDGTANTAVGTDALIANREGSSNIAVGYQSMFFNKSGSVNVAIGMNSMRSDTSGSQNLAIGYNSLYSNISGDSNVAIGTGAGKYETGSNAFYLSNVEQTNTANDKAYSLLYGKFSGVAGSNANQFLTVNGKVGIGTTAPDARLTVANKDGAVPQFRTYTSVLGEATPSDSLGIYCNATGKVGIGTTAPTQNFQVGTNILAVDVANGRVGIGKTNPSYVVDIVGAVYGSNDINGNQLIGRSNCQSPLFYPVSSTGDLNLATYASNNKSIVFKPNNSEVARITYDGKLGIGTTAPATKVHIKDGAIRAGVVAYTEIDSTKVKSKAIQMIAGDTTGSGSTANIGRIHYYNGHFYGLIAGSPPAWKQIDN